MNTIAQPARPGTWNFIPMLLALILASPAGTWPGGEWETQHWGVFSKTWAWFLLSLDSWSAGRFSRFSGFEQAKQAVETAVADATRPHRAEARC